MKKIILFFTIINLSLASLAQCDSVFFENVLSEMKSIQVINEKIMVAAGNNGQIIKSTDGGHNWRNIPNSYGDFLFRKVVFAADSIGYATGEGGIMKTEDQGENWFSLPFPTHPFWNISYWNAFFLNKEKGFFAGTQGRILSTVDGGESFKEVVLSVENFKAIDFLDDSTGLVAGREMFKTSDGGRTWREINTKNFGLPYWQKTYINKIKFITPTFLLAVGEPGIVATSSDQGETWTTMPKDGNMSSLTDFHFFDDKNGILLSDNKFYYTNDGALSFSFKIENPAIYAGYGSFDLDPSGKLLVAVGGTKRNIAISGDRGMTWSVKGSMVDEQFYHTQFLNDSVGFVSGENGKIFKTTDFGESWSDLGRPYGNASNPVKKFYFLDSLRGFASRDKISYTRDGGNTWVLRNSPVAGMEKMLFSDSLTGVGLYSGKVYRTLDGANSWEECDVSHEGEANNFVRDITLTPGNIIFTCSRGGNVLKSENMGSSWTSINLNNENLAAIYFYDDKLGFIGTTSDNIYKTTDGGTSWEPIRLTNIRSDFRVFIFRDSLNGFVLANSGYGSSSAMYQTKDGGHNWTGVKGYGIDFIYSISGINTIYAPGMGKIFKTNYTAVPSVPGYINGPFKVCAGTPEVFSVPESKGIKYKWKSDSGIFDTTDEALVRPVWKQAGSQVLSVSAQNTCGASPERKMEIMVQLFKPVLTLADTVMSVPPGINYKWYLNDSLVQSGNAEKDRLFFPSKPGKYIVEVTDSAGCTGLSDSLLYSLPLPYKLVDFSGKAISNKTIELEWIVDNEKNHQSYVVEKGPDSLRFDPVDSLPAKNKYIPGDRYSLKDANVGSGPNFYRLKASWKNGRVEYSHIISVSGNTNEIPRLYPNPVANFFTIYRNNQDIKSVSIYSDKGLLVSQQHFSSGQINVRMDISHLQPGMYFAKIQTLQEVFVNKFLKIK